MLHHGEGGDGSGKFVSAENRPDALRHVTRETGRESYTVRGDISDTVLDVLRPLLDQALRAGSQVSVPADFWRTAYETDGNLHVNIRHRSVPGTSLVSMTVTRVPRFRLDVSISGLMLVFADPSRPIPATGMVTQVGELERCIAWAWRDDVREQGPQGF